MWFFILVLQFRQVISHAKQTLAGSRCEPTQLKQIILLDTFILGLIFFLLISCRLWPLRPCNEAMIVAHCPSLFSKLNTLSHHFLQHTSQFDKLFRNIQELPNRPPKKNKNKENIQGPNNSYLGKASLPYLTYKRLNSRSRMEGLWTRDFSPAHHLAFRAPLGHTGEYGSKRESESFLTEIGRELECPVSFQKTHKKKSNC